MANNSLPGTTSQFIQLGNNMLAGLKALGTTLKITQITPAQFQTDLTAFVNADNAFNAARSARQGASDQVIGTVAEIGEWLGVVRGVLTGHFGARWNTMWAQAGFTNHSTAVPAKSDARIGLAASLGAFFTENPSYEVAGMEVTAAKALALGSAVQAATQTLATAEVTLSTIGQTWDGASAALAQKMRGLIKLLEVTLTRDDPRWLAFGLKMPATNSTPGRPQNLAAHLDGSAAMVVQCDPQPLATRYRWRTRIVGAQTEFELAASTTDPMASIREVSPGQTVEILVQAVNGSLQGVASEPIFFTLPLAKAAGFTNLSTTEEAPAVSERAQGNGNGHGRVARVA